MSDPYSPGLDGRIADDLIRGFSNAQGRAAVDIDVSPDDAARAIELVQGTDIPATAALTDVKAFESSQKRQLAQQIIKSNPAMADWINANPIASSVANDDYGQLDIISEATNRLAQGDVLGSAFTGFRRFREVEKEVAKGFIDGYGLESQKQEVLKFLNHVDHPLWKMFVMNSALPVGAGAIGFDTLMRTFSGLFAGLATGAGALATQLTGDKRLGNVLARDAYHAAQVFTAVPGMSAFGVKGRLPTGMPLAKDVLLATPEAVREAGAFTKTIGPWLEAGRTPPSGIHPLIDQAKAEQAKEDVDALLEATKEAAKSGTRDRAPDLFADLMARQTNAQIGISADAVRAIYGDSVPSPGDGKLGWIPNLAEQLALSEAYGGDIVVPKSEWLARIDPDMAKELRDDLRVRVGEPTLNEVAFQEEAVKFALEDKTASPEHKERFYFGEHGYFPVGDVVNTWEVYSGVTKGKVIEVAEKQGPPQNTIYTIEVTLPEGHPEAVDANGEPSHIKTFFAKDTDLSKLNRPEMKPVEGGGSVIPSGEISEASSVSARPALRPKAPVEAVRAATGLEPMFALGDRKLSLQKLRDPVLMNDGVVLDSFDLVNERGEPQAFINSAYDPKNKQLYITNIEGLDDNWTNSLGPSVIRDVLRQLKETYPEAETIAGYRISGAREAAGKAGEAAIKFEELEGPRGWTVVEPMIREALADGEWQRFGTTKVEGYIKPEEKLTEQQGAMLEAVNQALARIVPKGVDVQQASRLRREPPEGQKGQSTEPLGSYITFADARPMIAWSLEDAGALGTVRHEALHHLRQYNFFTPQEWSTLRRGALEQGWLEKFDINNRYKGLSVEAKLEEAIADGYKHWYLDQAKVPEEIKPMFERIKQFLDEIKERIKAILGKDNPTWEDIFTLVEGGEIGKRDIGEPRLKGAYKEARADEPELPGMTRMEDREAFAKASAIGMTVDQYKRYMRKIEERQASDFEREMKKAEAEQKRRQSTQWKEWQAEERPQAVIDVNQRPYVAADNFFRNGEVYGETFDPKPRINPEFLTPEQAASLPPSWIAKRGMNPDDIAPLFGYQSGGEMIAELGRFHADRVASKKSAEVYHRQMITDEVNRRVEAKHGNLQESILEEATDQALSRTQLELLHEESLALATQAGLEFAIDPAAFEREIRTAFERQRVEGVSSERILSAAGKAGRAAELALLKDKPAEAFREKQRQYIAIVTAREARQLEKDQAAVEKLAKRFGKREVKGVEQEFTNYIQALLSQAEYAVRLSPDEIQRSIDFAGYKSLNDFVYEQNSYGWEIAVSEDILANGAKPLSQMTVAEFREFKDAVDSLAYVGREVNKIEVAGQKMERAEFAAQVRENLETLPVRPIEGQGRWLYKIDASLTRMEEMIKDFDLRQELGPMFRAVIEPMVLSKTKKFDMLNDLVKTISKLEGFDRAWQRSLHDTIPQDFLVDPYYNVPFDLTRENLIQIMLNWGNRGNIEKLTRAYASENGKPGTKEQGRVLEQKLKMLIDKHATETDWKYVQEIWKLFKGWQKEAEVVSRNVSGVAPKWVEPTPVLTQFGQIEGGYYPVIYDKMRSNIGVIKDREPPQTGPMGKDYFRAATPTGHLKERTGYVDYVDITGSLEQVAGRMQQTIHDIAFRDAVIQTGKVFYDKEIRAAIRKHYGSEYEQQLVPWLRRVANEYTADEAAITGYNDFMRRARVNLVGHALPLNLKVIGSPDVGALNPKAVAEFEANRGANVKLAMEKSNEIRHLVYNMDRDFRERLEQTIAQRGWSSYQAQAVRWGFVPMMKASQEFRMVTFVQKYNEGLGKGLTEHEAALVADSFVRERHGAASIVDLPAVMTSNEAMKSLTMFYGFFNTMYNWQRQLPGNVRRGEVKNAATNFYGSVLVGAAFGALLFNQAKEDDSWWKIISKAMLLQPLSTLPVVREGASFFIEGFPQRTPTESIFSAIGALKGDVLRLIQNKPAKNPVKNVANVVGLATGLPLAQIGRTGEFLWDVNTGQQRPRNILEWIRGIVHGEARLKK